MNVQKVVEEGGCDDSCRCCCCCGGLFGVMTVVVAVDVVGNDFFVVGVVMVSIILWLRW